MTNVSKNRSSDEIDKERIVCLIKSDIEKIKAGIVDGNEEKLRSLHMMIDGKYSAYVPDWSKGTYNYVLDYGFNYEHLGYDTLKHNLTMFVAKLEGYLYNFPVLSTSFASQNNISVNVPVLNEISINITFEQAKQQIEDMPGLTDKETKEIIEKIDELENISKESISKKKKWEKVKPVLTFALDKSADVAIAIMSLILQMKLGM